MTGTAFRRELLRLFMLKKCITSTFPNLNLTSKSIRQQQATHLNQSTFREKQNGLTLNENTEHPIERVSSVFFFVVKIYCYMCIISSLSNLEKLLFQIRNPPV